MLGEYQSHCTCKMYYSSTYFNILNFLLRAGRVWWWWLVGVVAAAAVMIGGSGCDCSIGSRGDGGPVVVGDNDGAISLAGGGSWLVVYWLVGALSCSSSYCGSGGRYASGEGLPGHCCPMVPISLWWA